MPQGDFGPGTVYQCVNENAVRLDLDDLGGEIVRVVLCSHITVVLMLDANVLTCTSTFFSVCLIGDMVETMNQQSRHPTATLQLTNYWVEQLTSFYFI